MLVGQDVHKVKHLSPLYLFTASDHVLGDLQAGRYLFGLESPCWTPEQLQRRPLAGLMQTWRTLAVQTGLKSYRWARRRLKKNLIPWRRSTELVNMTSQRFTP